MAIIEKKYLLKDSILPLVKNSDTKKETIAQFYTQIEICKEIRFRSVNEKYCKTVRTGSDIRKNEIDKEIDKAKYLKAKKSKIGHILKKVRYHLEEEGIHYAIDKYKQHLDNLLLLEVSFKSFEDAENFTLPADLKPYIKKEVSDDNRYRNKNLALLGNPQKIDYNIYAFFKDIEQNRVTDVKELIFEEMIVSDAVRIVLYKIYHDLNENRQKLMDENDIHALEHFRTDLKEAKILLRTYRHVFDQNMYKKVYFHLSLIEKTIAVDKDLKVIKANITLLEDAFSEKEINTFISRIDTKIEEEKHKVKNFFKTRECAIIFKQFDLLIKEQSNTHAMYYHNTSIGFIVKSDVQKRFKKVLRLTKKYDKCHDLDSYKKIKKAMTKTKVLMEKFAYLYDPKHYHKMLALIDDSDAKISDFIDLSKRSLIIKTYIRNSDKELLQQQKLLDAVAKKRKMREKLLNKNIDHSIELLNAKKALFKGK